MADNLTNTYGRVREWIGPRIIPVFADEVQWSDETNYEPLMMVQNQGETFMSRQYVPAGAPLPDTANGQESTDYWVHMSNWNAQIEGYREEVLEYAQTVLGFSGAIDSLEDALPIADFDSTHTVSGAIDSLEDALPIANFDSTHTVADSITNLENDIDSLEDVLPISDFDSSNTVKKFINNKATLFKTKNILIFGDSWVGAYVGGGSFNPANFITGLNIFNNVSKVSEGGSGFSTTGDNGHTFYNLAEQLDVNYNIDIVLVIGGVNDGNASVNESDVNNTFSELKEKNPNAVIYYAPNMTRTSGASGIRRIQERMFYASKNGVGVIDCYKKFWCYTDYFGGDWWHLTVDGYKAFYSMCVSLIIGGNTFNLPFSNVDLSTHIGSLDSHVNVTLAYLVNNGNQNFVYFNIKFTGSVAANTTLFTIPFAYFLRAPVTYYNSTSMSDDIVLSFNFNNNTVEVITTVSRSSGDSIVPRCMQTDGDIAIQQINGFPFLA